jgi:putative solute:sodium symporter small subunit|tara:strand:- start:2709 stop:2978 length:270 start_codon:yes stop_codon:yes gene_type:complete
MTQESERNKSYWRANLKIVSWLMVVWFLCSFGFGIIFSDTLDQFRVGGFKLGFWFAQQGSIYIFILLVFIYVYLMNKLDKTYTDTEEKD